MSNGTPRITAEQAEQIRARHRAGESIYQLGEAFGVAPQTSPRILAYEIHRPSDRRVVPVLVHQARLRAARAARRGGGHACARRRCRDSFSGTCVVKRDAPSCDRFAARRWDEEVVFVSDLTVQSKPDDPPAEQIAPAQSTGVTSCELHVLPVVEDHERAGAAARPGTRCLGATSSRRRRSCRTRGRFRAGRPPCFGAISVPRRASRS